MRETSSVADLYTERCHLNYGGECSCLLLANFQCLHSARAPPSTLAHKDRKQCAGTGNHGRHNRETTVTAAEPRQRRRALEKGDEREKGNTWRLPADRCPTITGNCYRGFNAVTRKHIHTFCFQNTTEIVTHCTLPCGDQTVTDFTPAQVLYR